jgi:hypothetical protein
MFLLLRCIGFDAHEKYTGVCYVTAAVAARCDRGVGAIQTDGESQYV